MKQGDIIGVPNELAIQLESSGLYQKIEGTKEIKKDKKVKKDEKGEK